jgi:tetratricopeptide (TPR) repeat protein
VEPRPKRTSNSGPSQSKAVNRFNHISFLDATLPRCALLGLALVFSSAAGFGADSGSSVAAAVRADETNTQETLRAYLQLQEQLHATELAIERNRKEADAAAAEIAKGFGARLQGIEQALVLQRAQELEAMQSSNRVMLIVAGLFATLGLLAMMFMAYFQWRTINRLAEISAALPVAHALGSGPSFAALGVGESHVVAVGPAEQSNQRLLGALERLEQRIYHLEHTNPPPLHEGGSPDQKANSASPVPNGATAAPDAAHITVLLGKGQSLLNLDQAEEALACFDQVLALDPNHSEALVKKGAALERLRKLDEAIACYDRAIAADSSLTVAYLYKGGLFNRMERFGEALECYEQALRTQESRRG